MILLLAGLLVMIFAGIVSWFFRRFVSFATGVGAGGLMLGSLLSLWPALRVLLVGESLALRLSWQLPQLGGFAVLADALAAFFLCLILGVSIVAALFGAAYLPRRGPEAVRGCGSWLWFNLLVAAMSLVVLAHHALVFLVAWEVMALASFFLVVFAHESGAVRHAAWLYLVATHLGSALLLVMFVSVGLALGSLDFSEWGALVQGEPVFLGTVFVLCLAGFGVKAGLYPLHIWLPEAHPAAPTHASALLSGVMIKTGVYGLLRMLSFLGQPPAWWGYLLLALGGLSAVLGVMSALAQRDLKRLLAYCSVENIGIIFLGLGLGTLGWSHGLPGVMFCGFGGALLHCVNHALFKSLLFLGSGAVLHGTGTRDLEQLGGLLRRLPYTGNAFLCGAAAVSGLPPLNGFISEFLIYSAAFMGILHGPVFLAAAGILGIGILGLVGGLATACFTKAFGIAFLGEPRSAAAAAAHECDWRMRLPQVILAACCWLIPWIAPWLVRLLGAVIVGIAGPAVAGGDQAAVLQTLLRPLAAGSAVLVLVWGLLAAARRLLLRGRRVAEASTWDCGFARPTARMQYTGASFVQPFTAMWRSVLGLREHGRRPSGFFPDSAAFELQSADPAHEYGFRPLFRFLDRTMAGLRRLQEGRVQVYVLYVALTLLILLLVAW